MDLDNELLLKSFVAETEEGLAQMEHALLELESHPDDAELVGTVFRVVHSFKGNAAIFELKHAQDFAHALEDLLDKIRTRDLALSPEISDVLLASQDVLRDLTARAAVGKDSATAQQKKLLQRIRGQVAAKRTRKNCKTEVDLEVDAAQTPNSDEDAKFGLAKTAVRTLRVDVEKLDRLLDLTGEIAIARGRTTRLLENRDQLSLEELAEAHSTEAMLQAELQEFVMKVRMVPVGPLFRQYQRTIRDISKELGKTVVLKIEGNEVEVDTSVVEHLRDPLTHMIRNALDHGIEVPDERSKANKEIAGTITLRATHQSGGITVEVEDDGAGLNRARILESAQKRGITVDEASMTDHEVYQLVFESGISTADQISNLSGRGVGMDVVRRNVQALRGSVSITSQPGRGSNLHEARAGW